MCVCVGRVAMNESRTPTPRFNGLICVGVELCLFKKNFTV